MREGQTLELKLVWNENACKTVCAFANAEGGKLYLGYNDAGGLVGLKNAKADAENIPNTIRHKLDIFVSVHSGIKQGKEYIEIAVPAMDRPVFYDGKIYVRVGATNQLLDDSNAVNFLLRKSGGSWDSFSGPNVSLDELDAESFNILLESGIRNKRLTEYDRKLSRSEVLQKLSLLKEGRLTRAAILLFHPHPEAFFGGTCIKLGYFSENGQLRYQDELYGSLFTLAKKAEELLILKYFYATIEYDSLERVETLPYPREAVREGLLNALMHNDYRHAQPIAVRVSPRKLWISNKCVFPAGWTEKTLFSAHESKQFNPNIAAAFFRAGLVERFGTGIQKIADGCRRNGNPPPKFCIEPDMIRLEMASRQENITLTIAENEGANARNDGGSPKNDELKVKNEGEQTANDGEKAAPAKRRQKAAARRHAILGIMRENSRVTAAALSAALDVSPATIERDLSYLKAHGNIARTGSDKAGSWTVLSADGC